MELPLATAQMSRDWVRSPVAMKHRSLPDQVPEATRRPGTTASLTQSRGSKATTCILTTWCCIKDNLADSLADGESRRRTSLGITRAGLAKRCVTWLKLLLTPPPNAPSAAPMREFVDALGLFPALFDSEPSARSRRARLTWLLTHDRRLDASTREAATALIEACEHLGVLLWPDAETA